jgi:hypothetical protein
MIRVDRIMMAQALLGEYADSDHGWQSLPQSGRRNKVQSSSFPKFFQSTRRIDAMNLLELLLLHSRISVSNCNISVRFS